MFITFQICYELFTFPNHQQSDGWKCLPGEKQNIAAHIWIEYTTDEGLILEIRKSMQAIAGHEPAPVSLFHQQLPQHLPRWEPGMQLE